MRLTPFSSTLFQESMIAARVASVMFEIEIDDTLRQLSEGAR
jgi:hypothetical protein